MATVAQRPAHSASSGSDDPFSWLGLYPRIALIENRCIVALAPQIHPGETRIEQVK